MKTNNTNRRKNWIINKNFQYRFILMCIIPMFIMVTCFWLSVEVIFYRMLTIGNEIGIPSGHSFYHLLAIQKKQFHMVIIISSVVACILFGIWGVVFSHKIAGPMYRLAQFFKGLNKNDSNEYPALKFRDGDYFQEVAKEVNDFFERE